MLKLPVVVALTALVALAAPAAGQDTVAASPKKPAPLFASQDLLQFKLEADLGAVFKERGDSSTPHPATLSYSEPGGGPTSLPVEIQTRGHFRLQSRTCNFPPLRVNFPKDSVKRTLFAGQSHLKLTVHCQDKRGGYEQSVLIEHLIYRSFNLLTDNSFRVRLAKFTYLDTGGKRDTLTRYAFFVEDDDRMAGRLGGKVLEQKEVHDESTDPDQMMLVWLFEYFIGNTDWSVWALHNIVLVQRPNEGIPLAVPYDFDWSGVIDAPYARPDYRLPIKTVRERLFRGYCHTAEEFAGAIKLFNEKKDAIYQLYRGQEALDPKVRDDVLKYYDEFYKVINDPRAVRREFIDSCRKAAG